MIHLLESHEYKGKYALLHKIHIELNFVLDFIDMILVISFYFYFT